MALTASIVNPFNLLLGVAWQFSVLLSTQMLFPIYNNYTPAWRCVPPSSASTPFGSTNNVSSASIADFSYDCEVRRSCPDGALELEESYFYSAAVEFDWVCSAERGYLLQLYSQVQFFGVIAGMILFGPVSDVVGRKWISVGTMLGAALSIALSGMAVSATALLTARFFVGFFIGAKVVSYTLFAEMIPPELRLPIKTIANWGNARLLLTAVCFLFPNWRSASFGLAALNLPLIALVVFALPESPIWLHNKGRLEEMRKSERWIGRIAGRAPTDEGARKVEDMDELHGLMSAFVTGGLLRNPVLFKRISLLWAMWMCAALSSYTLDFSSGGISGNFFLNQIFMSLLISISKIVLLMLDRHCPKFSRRHLHQYSQAMVVVCLGAITAVMLLHGERSPLIIVTYSVGLMFIEFTWDAVLLCSLESIPTALRASAIGTCSLTARLGAILAPTVLTLAEVWSVAPYVLLSVVGTLNLAASYLYLVETKNADLDRVRLEQKTGREQDIEQLALQAGSKVEKGLVD